LLRVQISVAERRGYVLRNASLGDFVIVRTCTYTNLDSIAYYTARLYGNSLLLLGYKPVQHVTVLNTVGNCNTVVSTINSILLYYNIMGPPSYMRSVVDRNVVMRRIPVITIYRSFATRVSQLKNLAFLSYWHRKKRLQMHFLTGTMS
jgi:hypothetical protein